MEPETKRALIVWAAALFFLGLLCGGLIERGLSNQRYSKAISFPRTERLVVFRVDDYNNVLLDKEGNAYRLRPFGSQLHAVYQIERD